MRTQQPRPVRMAPRMTDVAVAAELAWTVLGWKLSNGRYLKDDRQWMPEWRFRPTERLQDAFRLLEGAAPKTYRISRDSQGNVHVRVLIGGAVGEAHGTSMALVITCAVAHALGIEVEL